MRLLYEWVTTHPRAHQKEILEAMEHLHGWSRSTTQHRLGRLVDGGALALQYYGRLKQYVPRSPPVSVPQATAVQAAA